MADWTNITDTSVDPDAPLTSQLAYAWRDNPIAIAEGASGAPRVMPLAQDNFLGRIVLDATTTPVAITGIDPAIVISAVGNFQNGTADAASIQVSASTDGGATWGGWFDVGTGVSGVTASVQIVANMKNGIVDSPFVAPFDFGAGPFNAIRFRHSATLYGSGNRVGRFSVYAIGRAP